ncbi:MAG TPA: UDP-N-acetylmuramoyl-tripeptide--D-alanyl-D-alanine ligase [Terriglobales bacterium]|nr:UDP-N-acetylmuramoyl-tripeptide--D-alanyl-D-alanine ligase [Terriglobales bacterium]
MSGLAPAEGISIDSRTLRPGEVYYALRGERLDGHDFVEAALAAGAGAAVVAAEQAGRWPQWAERLRPVPDPLAALQQQARARRLAWGGPLVAVTGSAGKTTTKEMIAAVLGTRLRVLKSEGNRNNHIGLPLTLLRLQAEHQVAVVEMGMNHAGEIARLAAIASPETGVFTNVAEAHLGNFASLEAIAEAKRELARGIAPGGRLVLNRDDARVARFGEGFAGTVVFYSGSDHAAPLRYPGRHNRANAAAAVATGGLFGVERAAAEAALAELEPPPGRGQQLRRGGMTLIHDCYNANPAAMAAMLGVLAETPGTRRVAVLGEMRELGAASAALHRQVGEAAARSGVNALLAVGGDAQWILEGARAAGFAGPALFCESAAAAAAALPGWLRPGDTVLFKASRGLHLEEALAPLLHLP